MPIICEESKYKQLNGLIIDKVMNIKQVSKPSYQQNLGNKYEELAIHDLNSQKDTHFVKTNVESKHDPMFRCSLDGIDFSNRRIAEVKYVGQKKFNEIHNSITGNEVPIKGIAYGFSFYLQIQYNLLVTNYEESILYIVSDFGKRCMQIAVPVGSDFFLENMREVIYGFRKKLLESYEERIKKTNIIPLRKKEEK